MLSSCAYVVGFVLSPCCCNAQLSQIKKKEVFIAFMIMKNRMSHSSANKNSNSFSIPPPNLSIQTYTFSAFFPASTRAMQRGRLRSTGLAILQTANSSFLAYLWRFVPVLLSSKHERNIKRQRTTLQFLPHHASSASTNSGISLGSDEPFPTEQSNK